MSRAPTQDDDLTPFETIFDEKVYNIDIDGKPFVDQLIQEQSNDQVNGPAKRLIANGSTITEGRLKHVSNQLQIEDDVLTKSGHLVLPASLRRFAVSKFHEIGWKSLVQKSCITMPKTNFIGRTCMRTYTNLTHLSANKKRSSDTKSTLAATLSP